MTHVLFAFDESDLLICSFAKDSYQIIHNVCSGCGTLILVSWPMPSQCLQKLRFLKKVKRMLGRARQVGSRRSPEENGSSSKLIKG